MENSKLTLEEFKSAWLSEIKLDEPTTVQVGHSFLKKIVSQYLDIEEDDYNFFITNQELCAINAAYFRQYEQRRDNLWYVFHNRYNAKIDRSVILNEIYTNLSYLTGDHNSANTTLKNILDKIKKDYGNPLSKGRIIYVIVTDNSISKRLRNNISKLTKRKFYEYATKTKCDFNVQFLSVETIYNKDNYEKRFENERSIPIKARLVASNNKLLIGSVKLTHLFEFLQKCINEASGDMDLLYQKNIRRYLGSRSKVNRKMRDTLDKNPLNFGLYNNGITIVVKDYVDNNDNSYKLIEPFIVNGCQTTKCIYKVFEGKSVNDHNKDYKEWLDKVEKSIVVLKIVKVGYDGDELLNNITRYTNSQNRVSQKDFIALEKSFQNWQERMEKYYNIFLEIQRGEIDSRKLLEKRGLKLPLEDYVNAFALLKVYGSGWYSSAGTAFRTNASFVPGGTLFKKFVKDDFGVDEFYATYLLHDFSKNIFGKKKSNSRRQTKFLFYQVLIEILREFLKLNKLDSQHKDLVNSIKKIWKEKSENAKEISTSSNLMG